MPHHRIAISGAFSVTIKVKIDRKVRGFAALLALIEEKGASVSEVTLLYSDFNHTVRLITVNCSDVSHSREIVAAVDGLSVVELLSWQDDTFEVHRGGKLEIVARHDLRNSNQLARVYTPGVARICTRIHEQPESIYDYTMKSDAVAVVTDGSAVLGLGNIGPEAALPVMEGKAVLFKKFGGLNGVPICLKTQDTDKLVEMITALSPCFGGINLEDISAPRCFEIEERLTEALDIPVFHDDQHGTAVVVLAGLLNALKLVGKELSKAKIVVGGFGAGGVACTSMLLIAGATNVIGCDSVGIVYRGREKNMNPVKQRLAEQTNPENLKGSVADAMKGADVFIGVSKPGVVDREMVATMNKHAIVFALANPIPEITPEDIDDLVDIIATGRSDYPNQVNNVLCFPGIFKGALACRASRFTEGMKLAAAHAIADSIPEGEINETNIIPSVFSGEVPERVAEAVRKAAIDDGVARLV